VSGFSLGKWLIVAAILYVAWSGVQVANHEGGSNISSAGRVSVDGMSPADITTLATTVRPGEVVLYGTDSCPYCAEARSWLNQYGFAFRECNMDVSKQCEREFMDYGGNGTPYLVVRGHHMKNGFDSVEFLMALREKT